MTQPVAWPEGSSSDVIWRPTGELRCNSGLSGYLRWLAQERDRSFPDYRSLWQWSVENLSEFWRSVWDFEGILADGSPAIVLERPVMPDTKWFPDVTLNFAEHLLRGAADGEPALVWLQEAGEPEATSWAELARAAGALAQTLRSAGVGRGDRVGAYLPNCPEAIVGLIACASLGAVWAVCSPDFGVLGVSSRFKQLAPKALIAIDGYEFGGRRHDRCEEVAYLVSELQSLENLIWLPRLGRDAPSVRVPVHNWADATAGDVALEFVRVPFDHPLWILFSSGTTGIPKGIVHGHGGILLEHLKTLHLHEDVRRDDRVLFMASTSWMVWNLLVSGLLVGATIVLVDGSPNHPEPGSLWHIVAREKVRSLCIGAGYIHASMKAGVKLPPYDDLRHISVTGSPLSRDAYRWTIDATASKVWLSSASGGTDVCTAFVGACPLVAVRTGRLQVPCLGVAVAAWNPDGRPVIGAQGELVVTQPLPSMPLRLWNDPTGDRLRATYFGMFPGVWRHGDYIEFDADGSSVIHGRSDATLNRNGIRIGSAEIYAVVESLPEVIEALVVGVDQGDDYYMPLFVVLADNADQDAVRENIIRSIRASMSPRHVPDEIIVTPAIPHTKTGKKLELPVKRLLEGIDARDALDLGAVDDPSAMAFFTEFARSRDRSASQRP